MEKRAAWSSTFIINMGMLMVAFHFGPLLGNSYAVEALATNLTLEQSTIKTSDQSTGAGRRVTDFPPFPGVQNSYYQYVSSKLKAWISAARTMR